MELMESYHVIIFDQLVICRSVMIRVHCLWSKTCVNWPILHHQHIHHAFETKNRNSHKPWQTPKKSTNIQDNFFKLTDARGEVCSYFQLIISDKFSFIK